MCGIDCQFIQWALVLLPSGLSCCAASWSTMWVFCDATCGRAHTATTEHTHHFLVVCVLTNRLTNDASFTPHSAIVWVYLSTWCAIAKTLSLLYVCLSGWVFRFSALYKVLVNKYYCVVVWVVSPIHSCTILLSNPLYYAYSIRLASCVDLLLLPYITDRSQSWITVWLHSGIDLVTIPQLPIAVVH